MPPIARVTGSFLRLTALLVLMLMPAGVALATGGTVKAGSTEFDTHVEIAGEQIHLRGTHTFTWWRIRVYTVAFYAEEQTGEAGTLLGPSTRRQLTLHYYRSISAGDFAEATEKALEENPAITPEDIRPELDQLYAAYASVASGDRYEVIYEPGKGTTLLLNGEERCTIEGEKFAEAFFGIWVADHGIDRSMARALRGE